MYVNDEELQKALDAVLDDAERQSSYPSHIGLIRGMAAKLDPVGSAYGVSPMLISRISTYIDNQARLGNLALSTTGHLGGIAYSRGAMTKRTVAVRADVVDPTIAINDHVCPTCKNDRCSKSEKTCWKCGSAL